MFNLSYQDVWQPLGSITTYRWIPPNVPYSANETWPGSGRFDIDNIPTLYLSLTPEGAVAEYLRRHPKLIAIQSYLKINLFEVHITSESDGLKVSDESLAKMVGIGWDRLRSSDNDKRKRYYECRQLAREVISATGVSIEYPSAALEEGINVVLFEVDRDDWIAIQGTHVPVPWVEPERVTPLRTEIVVE